MANVRLNIYENISLINIIDDSSPNVVGRLFINGVYIPGSISFNTVQALIRVAANRNQCSFTFSFGLYSLNGSTLSIANSASRSFTNAASSAIISYISLATSAIQDITPGNWYLGLVYASSSDTLNVIGYPQAILLTQVYGGAYISGAYSVTTGGLPTTILSSELLKQDAAVGTNFPYILISA